MTIMPLTYSITNGIGAGFIADIVIRIAQGKAQDRELDMYAGLVGFPHLLRVPAHPPGVQPRLTGRAGRGRGGRRPPRPAFRRPRARAAPGGRERGPAPRPAPRRRGAAAAW